MLDAQSNRLDKIIVNLINRLFFRSSSSLIILISVIAYFSLILIIFTTSYATNDDIEILETIKLDYPVSFMSYIFGRILSFTYLNISKSIPWYGLFLYISLGVSLFVLLRIFFKTWSLTFLFIAGTTLILYMPFLQKIGYNQVAIITGGIGILGFFSGNYRSTNRWYCSIGYGLLLCLSYLWRTQVIVFVLVLLLPAILARFHKSLLHGILFLLPCVLLIALNFYLSSNNKTPGQAFYNEFNHYRGQFHQTSLFRLNANNIELLQAIGWTVNDFYIFNSWLYLDENKFNIESVKQVIENPKVRKDPPGQGVLDYLRTFFAKYIAIIQAYTVWTTTIAYISILIYLYGTRNEFLKILLFIILIFGMMSLLAIEIRLPARLVEPMFFIIIFFSLFLLNKNMITPGSLPKIWKMHLRTILIFLMVPFLVFFHFNLIVQRSQRYEVHRATLDSKVQQIESIVLDPVYLIIPYTVRFYHRNPLKVYNYQFINISIGWTVFSPRFYFILKKIRLTHASEIFPYLISSSNAFLISPKSELKNISIFISETYGIATQFKIISKLGKGNINVYKIEKLGL